MRRPRFLFLPFALVMLLTACAVQPEQVEVSLVPQGFEFDLGRYKSNSDTSPRDVTDEPSEQQLRKLADEQSYELPGLADSVLERGFTLVGTPYRYGGSSTRTGFDCSGFVGFVFQKEAGLECLVPLAR